MQDPQSPFGINDEHLRSASVIDRFFRVSVAASYDAEAVKLKRITGHGPYIVQYLHIDDAELYPDAGLLIKVFTFATGYGQPSWFCAIADGCEDRGIGGVEFLQLFRRFRGEGVPETGDF